MNIGLIILCVVLVIVGLIALVIIAERNAPKFCNRCTRRDEKTNTCKHIGKTLTIDYVTGKETRQEFTYNCYEKNVDGKCKDYNARSISSDYSY